MKSRHLFYIAVIWLGIILLSYLWNYYAATTSTLKMVENKAQSFFDQIVVTRSWNSFHGGVYVPVTAQTQPNPYLKDSLRDVGTINGMRLTKINPAYMTRQIAEINKSENDLQFHITSLNPIRPANKADKWEQKVLLGFEHNRHDVLELVSVGSSSTYRYMAPLVTEKSCLKCHASQGYKVGDIRGGISISFPSSVYLKSQQRQTLYLFIAHFFLFLIGLAGLVKYYRTTSNYFSVITANNEKLEEDGLLLRRANKELSESLAQNRATVAAMPDILFSINNQGYVVNYQASNTNPMFNAGEVLIGKSLLDILPHPIAKQVIQVIAKAIETGELQIFEYKLDLPGQLKWFELRIVSSEAEEVLAISRDITERKLTEEQINFKNNELVRFIGEKDKFFSIIAHDLRSPFNAFLGLTQIMAEELHDLTHQEIQNFSITMRDSAANLYRLLENLLEWSLLQRGMTNFVIEPMLLQPKVAECIALFNEPARKKNIDLIIDIPGHISVFADVHVVETVIRNLISNAIKFTRPGGKVTITAKMETDTMVEVSVADTGIGMARDLVGDLFRPDIQTNRKGTDNEPSTGLGLILCKEFIEKNGGKIRVESEEGKGSVFHVSLPASS